MTAPDVWEQGTVVAVVLAQVGDDQRRTVHVDCADTPLSWQCDPTRGEDARWTCWAAEGPAGEGATPFDVLDQAAWWRYNRPGVAS